MFLDKIEPATLRTFGKLAVASGVGLILYNELGKTRPSGMLRFVGPILFVGGGLFVLERSGGLYWIGGRPTPQHAVSGAQEDADRAGWQAEEKKAKLLPWIVGGAAALVGTLYWMNR